MASDPVISTSTGRTPSTSWRAIRRAPRSSCCRSGARTSPPSTACDSPASAPIALFGYLSIPAGRGPFPAIYYAPKYQSVLEIIPQGTANLQRSRYITFALAARGQRNSDTPYAAMFPGLLTDGIDRATSYIFRGIVADSVRGLQFLLTRRELDRTRVVVVGNDLALITAALQPGATHVVTAPAAVLRHRGAGPQDPGVPAGGDQRLSARLSRTGRRPCAGRWPTTTCGPLRRA